MPKAKFTKDVSEWRRIKGNLRKGNSMINVGWFEDQIHHVDKRFGAIPSAQVAKWVEEGHKNGGSFNGTVTPPRPVIRTYFIPVVAESKDWLNFALPLIENVAQGRMSWAQLHQRVAPMIVPILQESLNIYGAIPNAQSTVSIKGFNNPWIETGKLRDTVAYKIVNYKTYSTKSYAAQTMTFA